MGLRMITEKNKQLSNTQIRDTKVALKKHADNGIGQFLQ